MIVINIPTAVFLLINTAIISAIGYLLLKLINYMGR